MEETSGSFGPQNFSFKGLPSDPLATALPMPTPGPTAGQLALHVGWTMALLYGEIDSPVSRLPELPPGIEMSPDESRRLQLGRWRSLVRQLASRPEFAGSGLPTEVPAMDEADSAGL